MATVEKLPMLQEGYEKLNADLKRLKIERPQAIASAFEVGLHNATLAIVIAQSVLRSPEMTLPGAVYGVLMFPLAAAFGFWVTRSGAR